MPSPFPGMDPYLEHRGVWADFHAELISGLRHQLRQRLPPNYDARINERIALFDLEGEVVRSFVPDAFVVDKGNGGQSAPAGQATALLEPVTLPLLIVHESRETYIEIYHRPERSLVGIIEVLSPTNKVGEGRGEYLAKRNAILCQPVHLVELDLLVGGQRLPLAVALPPADYFPFVSRADHRPNCQVYHWGVRQPLPTIAIPLKSGDPDVLIELSAAFQETYERGGYERDVDYSARLSLPLGETDIEWTFERGRSARS